MPHLPLRRVCVLVIFLTSVIQYLKSTSSGEIDLFWLTVRENTAHHDHKGVAAEVPQQGVRLKQLFVA